MSQLRTLIPSAFLSALIACAGQSTPTDPHPPQPPPEALTPPAGSAPPLASTPIPLGPPMVIAGRRVHEGDTSCGGYPRLYIEMEEGYCLGLVAHEEAPFSPRDILESPAEPGVFLISDFQRWSTSKGKIWRLEGGALTIAAEGLSLPHALRVGPGPGGKGQWVYLGEDHQITRFDPRDPSVSEVVIKDLPPIYYKDAQGKQRKNSFHPLSQFVFDGDNTLFVNIGAPTDHCQSGAGATCTEGDRGTPHRLGKTPADPTLEGAVIRRYAYLGEGKWDPAYTLVARGLRNSMGLAIHGPSQGLIQAENSRDFPESRRPFEEINHLSKAELKGGNIPHFGWPYCYDFTAKSDEWAGSSPLSCTPGESSYRAPWVLGPPHGAPLDMLYYNGDLFPKLKGQLIVSWHGYREAGHRLTAYEVDDQGRPRLAKDPTAPRYGIDDPDGPSPTKALPYQPDGQLLRASHHTELVSGWFESPNYRPMGAPVGMTVAKDGALWIVEDKTGAILRMAPFAGTPFPEAPRPSSAEAYITLVSQDPAATARYEALRDDVLTSPSCGGCHDGFGAGADPFGPLRYSLKKARWIVPGDAENSYLYSKLLAPEGGVADMPPPETIERLGPMNKAAISSVKMFINALPRSVYMGSAAVANIRSQPKTQGTFKCGSLPKGAFVGAAGETLKANGHEWLPITLPKGSAYLKVGTSGFPCGEVEGDVYYVAVSGLKKVGP